MTKRLRVLFEDGSIDAKLRALADASRHEFPTADIEVMLQEIESGRRVP